MRILHAPDYSMDSGAGSPPASDTSPEAEPKEGTFFLPSSPDLADYGVGDTIQLKVVGKDADGQLEVECQHDEQGSGMKSLSDGLREHMSSGSEGGENGQ